MGVFFHSICATDFKFGANAEFPTLARFYLHQGCVFNTSRKAMEEMAEVIQLPRILTLYKLMFWK
jgi:hypothetical protein